MAESFVDSFKTELIADRVWRTQHSWNSRSSNRSPRSTTTASTRASVTVPLPNWKHPTTSSTVHLPLSITEQRKPTNPISAYPSPPHSPTPSRRGREPGTGRRRRSRSRSTSQTAYPTKTAYTQKQTPSGSMTADSIFSRSSQRCHAGASNSAGEWPESCWRRWRDQRGHRLLGRLSTAVTLAVWDALQVAAGAAAGVLLARAAGVAW
jgi:hypothetical protein